MIFGKKSANNKTKDGFCERSVTDFEYYGFLNKIHKY